MIEPKDIKSGTDRETGLHKEKQVCPVQEYYKKRQKESIQKFKEKYPMGATISEGDFLQVKSKNGVRNV